MLPAEDHRHQAPATPAIARRLLIRPGAIGDTIVWLPAAEHWRAPSTEIWVPSRNLPLVRHLGATRSIASTGLDLFGVEGVEPPPPLLDALQQFDEVVSWYGANRAEFRDAAYAVGVPFRFFDALPRDTGGIHAVDFYLAQCDAKPGASPRATLRLPVTRRDDDDSRGFAVIHPFSGSQRKNWPLDAFRAVASGLESAGVGVRWCAGPEECLEHAMRFDDLGELASWLAGASVYIGNDSGISHLAAACGVPVVALFGPTDPRVWAPRGARVEVLPFETDPAGVVSVALRLRSEADRAHDQTELA